MTTPDLTSDERLDALRNDMISEAQNEQNIDGHYLLAGALLITATDAIDALRRERKATPCANCGSVQWHARSLTSCTTCGGKDPWRENRNLRARLGRIRERAQNEPPDSGRSSLEWVLGYEAAMRAILQLCEADE